MGYKKYVCCMCDSKVKIKEESLIREIEEARENLYILMDMSNDFSDKNIINQSQKLDRLLNSYEELKTNHISYFRNDDAHFGLDC